MQPVDNKKLSGECQVKPDISGERKQKRSQIFFRFVDIKFFPDIVPVKMNCPGADIQYAGDFFAGPAGFDKIRNPDFRGRKPLVSR